MFRSLYGNSANYGLSFRHPMKGRFDVGLRAEYIRLADNSPVLEYRTASIAPMLLYCFPRHAVLHPVAGVGAGLSYRRITSEGVEIGPFGNVVRDITVTQESWNVHTLVTAGLDLHLSSRFVIGGRILYDYYPFGDPTVGDFGDTGGFHFYGQVGVEL